MNTFPLNFGPDGAGGVGFYRTASGECIPDDGAWQYQGYVENGLCLISEQKTSLCCAGEIVCKARQDSCLDPMDSSAQQHWPGKEDAL